MNKVCVITNAGNALGNAYAGEMAKNGYSVALLDKSEETTFKIADSICTVGGLAKAYVADSNNYESLVDVYSTIKREFGRCTVLINLPCAEYKLDADNYNSDISSYFGFEPKLRTMEPTCQSTLLASRVFIADDTNPNPRSIINISNNLLDYYVELDTDADVREKLMCEATKFLALYFAKKNVRVNAILLGCILSEKNIRAFSEEDGTPNENAKTLANLVPLGRLGRVDDVCGVLSFLSDSALSGFMTGEVLHVDGGYGLYYEN